MNPNTLLYVTDKGSIILRGGRMVKPGDVIDAANFAGLDAQLQILLENGNLSEADPKATGLDTKRADELAPPIPTEMDLKTGKGVLRGAAGGDEAATLSKVNEIKARQAAQEKLAEIEPESELTIEEAKALGIVSE